MARQGQIRIRSANICDKKCLAHGLTIARKLFLGNGRALFYACFKKGNELGVSKESSCIGIEDFEVEDNDGLRVLPGVLQLLAGLPQNCWTVVTSATERLARVRLAAGGVPAPKKMVTAERVTRGKPHPEPFLAGAALLGLEPRDCVAFEDSASGAQAARDAGCTVIATTFSHPASDLHAAHYLVADMTQISVVALPGLAGLSLSLDR